MPRLVKDEGRQDARIVLIGEAPGQQEDVHGRPFVGPAGQALEHWWREVGLTRRGFLITNVYPYRPTANKIETVPKRELEEWTERLHERLAALEDPWLIVPTGNTALFALTGKKGILKHRGSILEYVDGRGRHVKVIPTIHPAMTFRDPWYERPCRADWKRIAEDVTFRELRLPERTHHVEPVWSDVEWLMAELKYRDRIAIDIETAPGMLLCVGFSWDPELSLTIPTVPSYWQKQGVPMSDVWGAVNALCRLPCEKVLTNGHYDTYWLAHKGIRLVNWRWDLKAMHHALDASDAHDLAYMASIDTRQPYWKDETKDPDESAKYLSNIHALWTYNGIDCCVELELSYVYEARLREEGLL